MNKSIVVGALFAVMASSCATMQVQKDKLTATKSIAIVGYSGTLALKSDKDKGGLAGTIGAIKGSADLMSGKLTARRVEQAELGYAELVKRLQTTFGFDVKDRAGLSASATYAGLMQKSPNQGLMVAGLQHVPEILRAEVAGTTTAAWRAAVAKELGVDALAMVKIRYEVGSSGGFAVAGIGKTTTYPCAVLDFTVYDANGEVLWHDFYARGEPTKEGLATTMGADIVANETEVLTAALSSGYDALLTRYREAK